MPAEFERCVKKVKAKGKVDNPYAVCRASMGTDKEILARRSGKMKHNSPPEHHKLMGCKPKPGWDK